jgi:aminoglycoside phosphotransferase (APT) family kinase protein
VTSIDPRDPAAVADVVRRRAADRWGDDVALAEPPARVGAGFDSHIHLVRLQGSALPEEWRGPLVVRLLPSRDRDVQAHEEAAAQTWCGAVGYPAPQVLEVVGVDDGFGLPTQVMERAPGTTMLDALKARPWRAFKLVDQLASLQRHLHGLPTADWPGPRDAGALVAKRLSLPRRAVAELDDPDLVAGIARAEGVLDIATSGPAVVCHGDFHPLNVMVDGPVASVIDWTDAGMGPREADVARTALIFHIASIAAETKLERALLKVAGPRLAARYRRAYDAATVLDADRMRAWEALHALHGWAQVALLHAGSFDGESSSDSARVPIEVAHFLRGRFEQSLDGLSSA